MNDSWVYHHFITTFLFPLTMFGVAFCAKRLLLYMLWKEKQKEGPKENNVELLSKSSCFVEHSVRKRGNSLSLRTPFGCQKDQPHKFFRHRECFCLL